MGIFGNIFGKKEPEQIELELGKAREFLEKEASVRKKNLLEETGKNLAEIRHLLIETKSLLEDLGVAESSGKSGRLDRIVSTAKTNALKQLFPFLKKLNPPNTENPAELRTYCLESIQAMQQAGHFGKNVAYAGISFKEEMKSIGENLKQVNKLFHLLKDLFDKNSAVFAEEKLNELLVSIEAKEKVSVKASESIVLLEKSLGELALKKTRFESELKELTQGPEFKEIASLNERKAKLLREKQAVKTYLLDIFAKIEKPLHRLGKAVNAGKILLPEKQASFLNKLLLNPVKALKLDPKAETLKSVLLETKSAIDSGLIELKPKEKEKKLAVISELLSFDFFSESFWKLNKIDSEILAIEKQLASSPASEKESVLFASLKELAEKQHQAESDITTAKIEEKIAKTIITDSKLAIQNLLSKVFEKKVLLKD